MTQSAAAMIHADGNGYFVPPSKGYAAATSVHSALPDGLSTASRLRIRIFISAVVGAFGIGLFGLLLLARAQDGAQPGLPVGTRSDKPDSAEQKKAERKG